MSDAVPCSACQRGDPCAENERLLRAEVARLQRDREEVVGALGKQAHPGLSPGENVAEVVAEVERLRKALEECSLNCEHLHHGKKDRHESGTPCPVEARVRAALEEKP